MCGLCKNVAYSSYRYSCYQCFFTLEVKCAFLSNEQYQDWNEKQSQVSRRTHFSHPHELILVTCTNHTLHCKLCKLKLSGSTYCCLDCQFFIHESCSEIQQEVQPSYHLPHRLIAQDLGNFKNNCGVCGSLIYDLGFSCYDCKFFVHFKCGTYPTSSLKVKFHQHSLFFFSRSILLGSNYSVDSFRCWKCHDRFSDSFYRCVECDLNVHLECMSLPKIVKHNDHCDPLTLMSSMREDDFGVYYCYLCQKPRDPDHPVYWCRECELEGSWFAAHVGCVIKEQGDASLEVISWKEEVPEPAILESLSDTEGDE